RRDGQEHQLLRPDHLARGEAGLVPSLGLLLRPVLQRGDREDRRRLTDQAKAGAVSRRSRKACWWTVRSSPEQRAGLPAKSMRGPEPPWPPWTVMVRSSTGPAERVWATAVRPSKTSS